MFTLSKLLSGFVKVVKWISLSCYMDLSKLFYLYLALCQTKPSWIWPRFQSLLKLLLWKKVNWWVKVLNELGPLCLWQCLQCIEEIHHIKDRKAGWKNTLLHSYTYFTTTSNSSDISNFDIFDNAPFQKYKWNAFQEPPGPPSLTISRTVILYISLCFRRYSDLLVRCFASLDRPCFAFARPRGRDRGSIDLLGAVLIGPGVAHQVGPSFPPCDIPETLRPVLVAPSLTPQSQNKLSIAACSQTAQQVNYPCQSSTGYMLSFALNT